MKEVILLMGLHRSGKSTVAHDLNTTTGYPIICPDDFRVSLHGQDYLQIAERSVWANVFVASRALLKSHRGLIIDACNVTRYRRDEWRSELESQDVVFKVFELNVPVHECLERAGNLRLMQSIERMAGQYQSIQADERPFTPNPKPIMI